VEEKKYRKSKEKEFDSNVKEKEEIKKE